MAQLSYSDSYPLSNEDLTPRTLSTPAVLAVAEPDVTLASLADFPMLFDR